MSLLKFRRRPAARLAGLATAVALALCGCNAGTAKDATETASASSNPDGGGAVVVRVIDGDTFVASTDAGEKTIRLLNVDTPETKDPNEPVECLGPEATQALEGLLPVGAKVRLELDQEPLDKYGRTLAGVYDASNRLVNAEVARQGLGVPVLFEPNRKFYQPVVDAFEEARIAGSGLASTTVDCLPAQKVERAAKAVESLVAAPLAGNHAGLDRDHAGLVAALATVAALKAAAEAKTMMHWAAYDPSRIKALQSRLHAADTAGTARLKPIKAKKKSLSDAAAAAKRRAAETAKRQAAAAKRQADAAAAAAAAAAEAERLRNLPPAPAPYVPPAYTPPVYVPPAAPAPAPNPYPGYTGPRCYAPGGQSWTPCSKR
ncbi:thermonuclease family protein [Arthrobacter sp. Hor0625]|uniref:thermonuclease family protein n=1 Tax=Arthrobacter sp. Hor0625 TaxID=3457358 RepID=UPI00403EE680